MSQVLIAPSPAPLNPKPPSYDELREMLERVVASAHGLGVQAILDALDDARDLLKRVKR